MPEMRYIGVDLLTRQVVEDLPLYGVSLTRRISAAGNMTGSYKLGTGDFSDEDLLSATIPGLRALYVLRDRVCVWAGPIWSRTYQSQANVMSMTGQSFESVFAKLKLLSRFELLNTDQTTIFKALIDRMQSQPYCNLGISTAAIQPTGVNANLAIEPWEHRFFSEPIEDLLKASNSFDYNIDYLVNSDDSIQLFVRSGYPYLGYGQYGIDLDYPGTVSNYYYPESGSKGIVRETVLGQGEGSAMPVAQYTNPGMNEVGYPMWEEVRSEKQLSDINLLSRIAEAYGQAFRMPVSVPTIDLVLGDEDNPVDFAEWGNMGVPINLHIQDARFPQGRDLTHRMLGWDYSPPSSEGIETLKLVLEGQE
jgi:hypothetical protein